MSSLSRSNADRTDFWSMAVARAMSSTRARPSFASSLPGSDASFAR